MSLETPLSRAAAWLRAEALRYVTIAYDQAARAEMMTPPRGGVAVNLRRRDQFRQMARDAAMTAEQFLGFAIAVGSAQPAPGPLEPGGPALMPVTFLRRCDPEDYPGQGLFRLPGGKVVRAPRAAFDPPAAAPANLIRSA